MKKQNFQYEHMKQLPLRAIVAFSVRCARRVQNLGEVPGDHPGKARLRDDVEAALSMAEGFAKGAATPEADSVLEALDVSRSAAGIPIIARAAAAAAAETAHAAAIAWHLIGSPEPKRDKPPEMRTTEARQFLGGLSRVSADLAALTAFDAALAAYDAVGLFNEDFLAAASGDYDRLLRLKLGRYPEPGKPIDPSPRGPLGPL